MMLTNCSEFGKKTPLAEQGHEIAGNKSLLSPDKVALSAKHATDNGDNKVNKTTTYVCK